MTGAAGMDDAALLDVQDLRVSARGRTPLEIVHGVDVRLRRGEIVGIVGESGSGKSLSMLALMRLLDDPLQISGGSVTFRGRDLATLSEPEIRTVRGREIAMIYQDPMTSLNPLMRVGDQVVEGLRAHGVPKLEAKERCVELFTRVGIPDPARTMRAYPHEFSGGMRQRVVIAMALALRPALLIADEPTTALDVTIQQQILALVAELQAEMGMTTIWVTHDLGVVARLVQRVIVMYAGRVVEDAPVGRLFSDPQHPYTERLLAALPNPADDARPALAQIPGRPALPTDDIEGCPFRPRCPQARERCREAPPLIQRGATRTACWVPPEEWN
jgi:oligopeptide/dipeptide ABC transporter ATP-binding protein